jgi:hypothetical protein
MNTLFKTPLFIAYLTAINLASSIAVPARADVVTDWNNAALDAIRAGNTTPPIASRRLAILHVQSTMQLTESRALMKLTWCQAPYQPAHRGQRLPVLRRTRRW